MTGPAHVFARKRQRPDVPILQPGAFGGQPVERRIAQRQGPLPRPLLEHIAARERGNPIQVEELLDDLHDRALDPGQCDGP